MQYLVKSLKPLFEHLPFSSIQGEFEISLPKFTLASKDQLWN